MITMINRNAETAPAAILDLLEDDEYNFTAVAIEHDGKRVFVEYDSRNFMVEAQKSGFEVDEAFESLPLSYVQGKKLKRKIAELCADIAVCAFCAGIESGLDCK